MEKRFFICIFIFIFALSGLAHSAIYYLSNSGNDNNPGTSQEFPWQTISKVNSMMSSFIAGDQILFNKGDKFFGTLTITKTGTAGNYLTFGSYGGGNLPEITGKKTITGWTLYSGNIYRTFLNDTVSHLYVSEKLMTIARYPNTGFLKTDYCGGNTGFYDAQLTEASGYWNGATCRIRTINWAYEIRTVANFSNGNITFTSQTGYSGYTDYGYYLDNKLNLLDAQGEWYYDKPTGYLYFYAPGGVNPNTLSINAVTLKYGITNIVNIHYLKIQDLKITGYRENGIEFYNGNNKIIQGCFINHNGLSGIRINGLNHLIENNTFEDNLNTGVTGVITNGVIRNNILNRTGIIAGYGGNGIGCIALNVNVCPGTTVEFNKIDSSGYSGIEVAKNTIVSKNIISYSCLQLNDGGGIDITESDTLRILNNIVTNTIGNDQTSGIKGIYSCGIYLNGGVMKNSIIQGNTVCYSGYNGIVLDHKNTPVNNQILDNVCYNNFASQIHFGDYSAVNFIPSYNTIMKRNIFFSLSSGQSCMDLRGFTSGGIPDFGFFDSNYYCNPYSDLLIRRTSSLPTYTTNVHTLSYWQNNFGKDLNSHSLPFSFSQYAITDTLSNNMITNSNFTNNIDTWAAWPYGLTIDHTNNPQLDSGCMRMRWNGGGYSECLNMSNRYSITKGNIYLVSLSCTGNHSGIFNLWGRSSFNAGLATFPQTFLTYENYRKDYSFTFKADTTDPLAFMSIGLKLPDSLVYVDNVNMYKVGVSKIDSTQMSKIFINENNYQTSFSLGGITYKDLNGNPVTGSIILEPYSSRILINESYTNPVKNLQLKVFTQGFYNANSNSSVPDTMRVYFRNNSSPYELIDSSKSIIDASGNGTFNFSQTVNSVNYYLIVKHRNSIETWSSASVSFVSNSVNYDFTASVNMAYGNNLILKGTKYCLYGGDVNSDDIVDIVDNSIADNAAYNFLSGYVTEDVNGDGLVDVSDVAIISNNAAKFITIERP